MLSRDEPMLVTGVVDAPWGEGETARERLKFVDAKLLSKVRAEKSSLLDIKLNADVVREEQIPRAGEGAARVTPAGAGWCCAWRSRSAARRCSTSATTTRSRPPTSCWRASSRSSARASRSSGKRLTVAEDSRGASESRLRARELLT